MKPKKRSTTENVKEHQEVYDYDSYAAMPEDGNRYEVVNGRLELMSPGPSTPHQSISGELEFIMKSSCSTDYIIYDAPLDVILSEKDVRQPDIMMIHRSRMHIITRRGIEGAPDLVVEIMSPGSRKRDKVSKSQTYAKYGVLEYWIIDPEAQTLELYILRGERFELAALFEGEDIVTSERLPCVSFSIKAIFAKIPDFLN